MERISRRVKVAASDNMSLLDNLCYRRGRKTDHEHAEHAETAGIVTPIELTKLQELSIADDDKRG